MRQNLHCQGIFNVLGKIRYEQMKSETVIKHEILRETMTGQEVSSKSMPVMWRNLEGRCSQIQCLVRASFLDHIHCLLTVFSCGGRSEGALWGPFHKGRYGHPLLTTGDWFQEPPLTWKSADAQVPYIKIAQENKPSGFLFLRAPSTFWPNHLSKAPSPNIILWGIRFPYPGSASGKEPACQCRRHEVQSLDQEEPLEEGLATHSSILAWRISRTEEPGITKSWMWLKRLSMHIYEFWWDRHLE